MKNAAKWIGGALAAAAIVGIGITGVNAGERCKTTTRVNPGVVIANIFLPGFSAYTGIPVQETTVKYYRDDNGPRYAQPKPAPRHNEVARNNGPRYTPPKPAPKRVEAPRRDVKAPAPKPAPRDNRGGRR